MIKHSILKPFFLIALFLGSCFCQKSPTNTSPPITPIPPTTTPPVLVSDIDLWLTNKNQNAFLQKQTSILSFANSINNYPTIEIDDKETFQSIDGFGFTLTGGSASVINQLSATEKTKLLQELFGNTENSIAINYIRLSIGASDLNSQSFTYNDLPAGETDSTLSKFSIENDRELINLLKEILIINPTIKLLATPWSAPIWMKDKNSFIGGSLQPIYYAVYAQYFVKYLQAMKQEGIFIDAITPQNEPLHPGNNPSMYMLASEQAIFIKNHLSPAFQKAGINSKIIVYDHNCDNTDYPLEILNDAQAKSLIDGSAFHLYAGNISALSIIHSLHPTKNVYFTEQYTASTGDFSGDLKWHLKNVIIGSMRNWSKTALEWNLANDASFKPHTAGGCTTCKGALTIDSGSITRNVGYYIVAHASKFVPTGSIRVASNIVGNLQNVAFKTPNGKIVLIVENDGNTDALFNIKINEKWATASLPAGSVGSFIW